MLLILFNFLKFKNIILILNLNRFKKDRYLNCINYHTFSNSNRKKNCIGEMGKSAWVEILSSTFVPVFLKLYQLNYLAETMNVNTAKYPYLQIPWDYENPIVDPEEYSETFEIPGSQW